MEENSVMQRTTHNSPLNTLNSQNAGQTQPSCRPPHELAIEKIT